MKLFSKGRQNFQMILRFSGKGLGGLVCEGEVKEGLLGGTAEVFGRYFSGWGGGVGIGRSGDG